MGELENKTTQELLRMLVRSVVVVSTVHLAGADSARLDGEYEIQTEIEKIILSRTSE